MNQKSFYLFGINIISDLEMPRRRAIVVEADRLFDVGIVASEKAVEQALLGGCESTWGFSFSSRPERSDGAFIVTDDEGEVHTATAEYIGVRVRERDALERVVAIDRSPIRISA